MNHRLSTIAFALALLLVGGLVYAAGSLDGKTFVGDSAEKGKTTAEKDELIFADGKFRSTNCDQYGFTAAPYTAKTAGDTTTFESVATSEKEGTIEWKGTVKGDVCEATLVWKKAGQKDIEYWFKGSLKK